MWLEVPIGLFILAALLGWLGALRSLTSWLVVWSAQECLSEYIDWQTMRMTTPAVHGRRGNNPGDAARQELAMGVLHRCHQRILNGQLETDRAHAGAQAPGTTSWRGTASPSSPCWPPPSRCTCGLQMLRSTSRVGGTFVL